MKKKRRFLSLLTAALVLVSTFTAPASAAVIEDANTGTLTLKDGREVQYHINPLYDDVVDENYLKENLKQEEQKAGSRMGPQYTDESSMGTSIRNAMISRSTDFTLYISSDESTISKEKFTSWLEEAVRHTGYENEGDYLAYHYAGSGFWVDDVQEGEDGKYLLTVGVLLSYYTDAYQEYEVDKTISTVFGEDMLDINSIEDDYDKAKAIYNWVVRNVSFDEDNLDNDEYTLKYTAYDAVVNHKAVCQGYANLLYRMFLRAGLDARIVHNEDVTHSWNIVKLGDVYYMVDASYDAQMGHSNFDEYERFLYAVNDSIAEEFVTGDFAENHPISDVDFKYTNLRIPEPFTGSEEEGNVVLRWGYSGDGIDGFLLLMKESSSTGYELYAQIEDPNADKYELNDLSSGKTYNFKLVPFYYDGEDTITNEDVYASLEYTHVGGATLSAPENLQGVLNDNDTITVTWDAVVGADGYIIEYFVEGKVSETRGSDVVEDTTYTIKNLLAEEEYDITVYPYINNGGDRVDFYDSFATIKVMSGTTGVGATIEAPINLKADKIGADSVEISWGAGTLKPFDGYNLFVWDDEEEDYIKVGSTDSETSKYTFKDLNPETEYTFAVSCYREVNGEKIHGDLSEGLTVTTKKGLDTPVLAINVSYGGQVDLVWDAVEDAEGYILYRYISDLDEENTKEYKKVATLEDTSYTEEESVLDYDILYKLVAYYTDGDEKVFSKESNIVKYEATEDTNIVRDLEAELTYCDEVTLTWSTADNAEGYNIYCKSGEDEDFISLGSSSEGEYVAEGLDVGKEYTFKVYAYQTAGGQQLEYGADTVDSETKHEPEVTPAKEATCTSAGHNEYSVCAVCDEDIVPYERIPAKGHSGEWVVDEEATCQKDGFKHRECTDCGETEEEEIPMLDDHNMVTVEGKAPTCTETGLTEGVACSFCGEAEVEQEEIPALGHEYSEFEVTKEPTCTEDGSKSKTCSNCDDVVTEVVEATGHTFGDWVVVNKPTCTENGSQIRTCSSCDESEPGSIPSTGHKWVDREGKESTCTEDGYTAHKQCSTCDEVDGKEVIPATGHAYSDFVVDKKPTCTEEGSQSKTCSNCDDTIVEVIKATGHNWVDKEGKEATCTEDGYTAYEQCSACEEVQGREVIEAVGHHVITTEYKAPTCTEEGLEGGSYCDVCDEVFEAEEVIPATGHAYGDFEVTKEPTCTEAGSKAKTCGNCDDTVTEEIAAKGHSHSGFVVDKKPTCTEEGSQSKKCENCDDVITEAIPAIGHNWVDKEGKKATCTEDGYTAYEQCSGCDEVKGKDVVGATGHSHGDFIVDKNPTCTEKGSQSKKCECGDTITEDIPATGHNWVDKAGKKPTCTKEGWTEHKQCSVCEEITGKEVVPATGHVYGDWITGKKATCTEEGYKYKECACEDVVKETIPAKGHKWNENYTVDKKATYAAAGSKSIHCANCNVIKDGSKVTIPKLKCTLAAPKTLTTKLYGHDDVKVSWSSVKGAKGYAVYIKKVGSNKFTKLGTTTKLFYKKANLGDGTKYQFKVVPYVTENGKIFESSKYRTSTIVTLITVKTPTVKKSSNSYVKVSWKNIQGETGYQIAKSKYKNKKYSVVKTVNHKYSSAKIKTTKKTKYYYKVRAYRVVDGKKIYAPWSAPRLYTLK